MPVPIITVAQMREWEEATWAGGQSQTAVIARVGELVARRVRQCTRPGDHVLILAGSGHNGDDARQAQPHLSDRQVDVLNVSDPQAALTTLRLGLKKNPTLIIDGLFGIGLNRPLDAHWRKFIARVNKAGVPVLSVDVPSGLNAETGTVEGEAIQATVTLTLAAPKRGLFAASAVPFVGRLELAPEIGLAPCPFESDWQWTQSGDFAGFPPPRAAFGHKGMFGHLAIVAGAQGSPGAGILAARGAQRARPGLITIFPQKNVYLPIASQLQAVMVQAFYPDFNLGPYTAFLFGPGLGAPTIPPELRALVGRLWSTSELPIIVDASALDWLPPERPLPKQTIRVITPHPGEAARLLKWTSAGIQADRPKALRELSARFSNCWVVLKGHQTLVGRSEGELFVNPSGNPDLAQGGSGDLLAGYVAGWLAQPALQADPATAIRHAVWQHGAAADELSQERRNWVIEDLEARLGNAKI